MSERAVFAFPGDVPSLRAAGGELVGAIAVSGNGFADRDDVRERALEEAATLGGTHVFIGSEEANTNWTKISNDRAVTTVNGNTASTTFQPGAVVPITRYNGSFIVVRVLPERWSDLPRQLKPRPNAYARRRIAMNKIEEQASEPAPSNLAATEPPNWYCQAQEHSARCYRQFGKCNAADTEVVCEAEPVAFCFSARDADPNVESADTDTPVVLRCYATIKDCRASRDETFANGAAIVQECSKSE